MVNKYYEKHKERLRKEAREKDIKIFLKKKKTKGKKKLEKNVKGKGGGVIYFSLLCTNEETFELFS